MRTRNIAIAGNIGVGKTTLINKLVERFNCIPIYETVDINPYLVDYYKDPKRYCLELQMYFLSERVDKYKEIRECRDNLVISDRCIYEDIDIFTRYAYEEGIIDDRGYDSYLKLSEIVLNYLEEKQPIEYIFYLRNLNIDEIMERIVKRNRDFEQTIPRSYIEKLNNLYERNFLNRDRVITIDITDRDLFEERELERVISIIRTTLTK